MKKILNDIRKYIIAWCSVYFDKTGRTLVAGYMVIICSLLMNWIKFEQAGAVLVGFAIAADIFHKRDAYSNEMTLILTAGLPFTVVRYEEKEVKPGDVRWQKIIKNMRMFDGSQMDPDNVTHNLEENHYYIVSKASIDENGLKRWNPRVAVENVHNCVDWVIALSAIIGTVIWAFGGNLKI